MVDFVTETLSGQEAAARALHDLRGGHAAPDLLQERLQAVLVTDEPERLRAFCRSLQKRLEAV